MLGEYTRTVAPTHALAADTLALERTLSDLVNQALLPHLGGDHPAVENRPAPTCQSCGPGLTLRPNPKEIP